MGYKVDFDALDSFNSSINTQIHQWVKELEDIANAAWYFGTDASKNVTGAELIVDGGMSCQLYPQLLNELKRKAMEEN